MATRMNTAYRYPADCPETFPVFPLPEALLLPRGQLPLNIFEPRYIDMVDEALRTSRVIGIVQPNDDENAAVPKLYKVGCAGRLTQFSETGDGRYLITLVGMARFQIIEEVETATTFRQVRASFEPFARDFIPNDGEQYVDRDNVLRMLRDFAMATDIEIDWQGIERTPNEALVNALSMMSPYGVKEKQALLEAETLKDRAETLIAITEIELARLAGVSDQTLQ
ncbi:LON peptidase substrate-binding domain-containing protein [Microvirga sp. W0021]|uniref:LON peptidase substrate-binding domain-containing protein n=1 Tax=Hohaiivirga grylli TaxID=3133970 RepID=A0ABV0BFZ1_9HYPH